VVGEPEQALIVVHRRISGCDTDGGQRKAEPQREARTHRSPRKSPRQCRSPYAVYGVSPNARDAKPDAFAFPAIS
jgi:hypothetical protein